MTIRTKINKKYQIIYADPPWDYGNWSSIKDEKLARKCGRMMYPTMKLEEICALPVDKIADKNCILFMWAVMANLEKAFEVIKKWGFIYKCCAFVWVKTTSKGIYSGLGNWTLGNAELCLLSTHKDFPKRQKPVKQIIMSPKSRHSEKPNEARKRIVEMMGDLPRIELFARKKQDNLFGNDLQGWDIWGNEVESDINLISTNERGKNE